MRKLAIWALVTSWMLFLAAEGRAQSERPFLNFRFNRQNNFTWNTYADLWYTLQKGKYDFDLRAHHDNIFNTSQPEDPFVQLYLKVSLWQRWKLGKRLKAVSWLDTDQYMNSRNEKYSLYGGVSWKPLDYLEVIPLLGYSFDRRSTVLDDGISPAFFLNLRHQIRDDLQVYLRGFARMKFIDPRVQSNFMLINEWQVDLEGNSSLMTGVRASSHELDDYTSNSVQKIISDTLNPVFNLQYEFAPGFTWSSTNQLSLTRRKFNFNWLVPNGFEINPISGDTTFAEFNNKGFAGIEVQTRQELSWRREKFSLMGAYEYQFISRTYDLENSIDHLPESLLFIKERDREKEKDFLRSQQKIEAEGNFSLSKGQRLSGRYAVSYLQFDTPSEANFNDRDELSYMASAGWSSVWSKKVRTGFLLSGNYRHLAYLFGERSQDNYQQRSLRLDFNYSWNLLENLTLDGNASVYVTYNVKDFPDYNNTDRSTRNLETNLKMMWKPLDNLEVQGSLARKETHQSTLNWINFSEATLDTNRILTAEISGRYFLPVQKKKVKLFADLGYKHFRQIKMLRSAMFDSSNLLKSIFLDIISLQTGPTSTFGFSDRRGSNIELRLWWQTQIRRNNFREGGTLNSVVSPLREEALRQVSVEFRPYVYLNVNYFFGRK
ncbi:MAG: hypothetical protein H6581_15740 [Bacteroidia bacterium]|nr:hypothetical protein [Bacteroidia bacterium]